MNEKKFLRANEIKDEISEREKNNKALENVIVFAETTTFSLIIKVKVGDSKSVQLYSCNAESIIKYHITLNTIKIKQLQKEFEKL